ncbi:K+ transporter Trk [Sporomusaceae bacterium FL31]|nr:K+ transporter Trk [Sporomusaceae bacterium FL31]GCE35768.1 K+ transporter Trk [Sporomusaceae bacterium]
MKQKPGFANLLDLASWRLTPYQILSLGFAGLILVGAILLMTPLASTTGQSLSFIDALFTSTSAVCVTGLAVVDTGTYFSLFGQIVLISLVQVGGLGIMTMATLMALIMRKKIQLRERLIMQEGMNQLTFAGIVRLTKYVIQATLAIELIGGTVLAAHWYPEYGLKGIYFGYWHAISSFCNAGFDLLDGYQSLTLYVDDITVNLTIGLLIILGGIGFTVLADIWENRKFDALSLHTKVVLVTSALLIFIGTIMIFILEYSNSSTLGELSLKGKIIGSYFQAISPRSAGYNTVSIADLRPATLLFIIMLMFIGASPASTGGGVKITTFAVLTAAIWALIRGKKDAELFQRRIPQGIIYKSFAVVFIASALIIFVAMMLSISESFPFLNILFEVVSAFGTVGLSTGITSSLTDTGKLWISLTMFAGRVGPVTLALALAMRTKKSTIQYPEGKITIG